MISDITMEASKAFGMLQPTAKERVESPAAGTNGLDWVIFLKKSPK